MTGSSRRSPLKASLIDCKSAEMGFQDQLIGMLRISFKYKDAGGEKSRDLDESD